MPLKKRKKKWLDAKKNKKLDEFLKTLDIEDDKREKILEEIENLTFDQLKSKSVKKKCQKTSGKQTLHV
ncbi:MAG: hypothetical protein GY861_06290 [bacterium]|nr:hypothetical protein [bacterium]